MRNPNLSKKNLCIGIGLYSVCITYIAYLSHIHKTLWGVGVTATLVAASITYFTTFILRARILVQGLGRWLALIFPDLALGVLFPSLKTAVLILFVFSIKAFFAYSTLPLVELSQTRKSLRQSLFLEPLLVRGNLCFLMVASVALLSWFCLVLVRFVPSLAPGIFLVPFFLICYLDLFYLLKSSPELRSPDLTVSSVPNRRG